jgi:hypothetical protein
MTGQYRRTYTLSEMLDIYSRLSGKEGSGRDGSEKVELAWDLRDFPLWRRRRVALGDLLAQVSVSEKVQRYASRRRSGARFPPIIAIPVGPDRDADACARMGIKYAGFDVVEGNHRVLAARAAGDGAIDAFVPAR